MDQSVNLEFDIWVNWTNGLSLPGWRSHCALLLPLMGIELQRAPRNKGRLLRKHTHVLAWNFHDRIINIPELNISSNWTKTCINHEFRHATFRQYNNNILHVLYKRICYKGQYMRIKSLSEFVHYKVRKKADSNIFFILYYTHTQHPQTEQNTHNHPVDSSYIHPPQVSIYLHSYPHAHIHQY